MYVCKYMCVCIWIYMYVNFFCFVLFSFIRGKGGRQLCPSLSGTVGGVTSPYTNTPFLGKKITWGKKMKKDYTSTRRTPRHSWGKKIHWEKKCKKTFKENTKNYWIIFVYFLPFDSPSFLSCNSIYFRKSLLPHEEQYFLRLYIRGVDVRSSSLYIYS